MEKTDMLTTFASDVGLEAYWRGMSDSVLFLSSENGKKRRILLEGINALSHQYINVAKSDMLHKYAPWGGLEAYWRGVDITNVFGVKMRKDLR